MQVIRQETCCPLSGSFHQRAFAWQVPFCEGWEAPGYDKIPQNKVLRHTRCSPKPLMYRVKWECRKRTIENVGFRDSKHFLRRFLLLADCQLTNPNPTDYCKEPKKPRRIDDYLEPSGIEPPSAPCESAVLPLYHGPEQGHYSRIPDCLLRWKTLVPRKTVQYLPWDWKCRN